MSRNRYGEDEREPWTALLTQERWDGMSRAGRSVVGCSVWAGVLLLMLLTGIIARITLWLLV